MFPATLCSSSLLNHLTKLFNLNKKIIIIIIFLIQLTSTITHHILCISSRRCCHSLFLWAEITQQTRAIKSSQILPRSSVCNHLACLGCTDWWVTVQGWCSGCCWVMDARPRPGQTTEQQRAAAMLAQQQGAGLIPSCPWSRAACRPLAGHASSRHSFI